MHRCNPGDILHKHLPVSVRRLLKKTSQIETQKKRTVGQKACVHCMGNCNCQVQTTDAVAREPGANGVENPAITSSPEVIGNPVCDNPCAPTPLGVGRLACRVAEGDQRVVKIANTVGYVLSRVQCKGCSDPPPVHGGVPTSLKQWSGLGA